MVGMLQILTYLLSFYLVIKGIQVLQAALTSARADRTGPIILGSIVLAVCVVAAIGFSVEQDEMASSIGHAMPSAPTSP